MVHVSEWWRMNKCNGLNFKGNRGGWSFPLVNRDFIHMNGEGFGACPNSLTREAAFEHH